LSKAGEESSLSLYGVNVYQATLLKEKINAAGDLFLSIYPIPKGKNDVS